MNPIHIRRTPGSRRKHLQALNGTQPERKIYEHMNDLREDSRYWTFECRADLFRLEHRIDQQIHHAFHAFKTTVLTILLSIATSISFYFYLTLP